MARFRATIHGSRGPASRLGGSQSGITASVNGWRAGVDVRAHVGGEQDAQDVFDVVMTGGSGGAHPARFLGRVRLIEGVPTWEPEVRR